MSKKRVVVVPIAVLALVGAATLPAQAGSTVSNGGGPQVVATGLDNPRQLSLSGNTVYVAEAGVGGSGPCMDGAEGRVCFGLSGAVTQVRNGQQSRVVEGLPSLAGPDGSSAVGPADVEGSLVSLGLGAPPAARDALTADAATLGTVVSTRHGVRTVADLAAYEQANDPDGAGPDSNPVGMARRGPWVYAVDAGGNSVVKFRAEGRNRGQVSLVATLPTQTAAAPPFLGLPPGTMIPVQSVPTDVEIGPDGALYVCELTGFPFPVGQARIFRIGSDGVPTVWASGLTNVTDIAFAGGSLYAVQLADTGLLAAGQAPPVGSLVKVRPGAGKVTPVATGLTAPYGVAISGRDAYVTTCSVCADTGQVVRIPLPRR